MKSDVALIVGVPIVACTMGLTVAVYPAAFLSLLWFHTWFFGFDHVVSTFTRLAWRSEDRLKYHRLIYVLPPVVLFALMLLGFATSGSVLATGYFVFQWYHTTRQSWGIAQHYRQGAPVRYAQATLWCIPMTGMLHRCYEQPERFLFMDISLPAVPLLAVQVAAAVSVVIVLRFLLLQAPSLYKLYMCTHVLVFTLAYLAIDNFHAGWLLVNVWHNLQYLVFVWMKNQERFASGQSADAPVLSWLSQPAHAHWYFAAIVAVSIPLFVSLYALTDKIDLLLYGKGVVSVTLIAAFTINFHHYIVDAIIWKRTA